MTIEAFFICEGKNGKTKELKYAVKDDGEVDMLIQSLEQEYILLDVLTKDSDRPIDKYGKRWGRVKITPNKMTELNDTLKERKRILQGVRKLRRHHGRISYEGTLRIIFDKETTTAKARVG